MYLKEFWRRIGGEGGGGIFNGTRGGEQGNILYLSPSNLCNLDY